jgi:hypothetical protein
MDYFTSTYNEESVMSKVNIEDLGAKEPGKGDGYITCYGHGDGQAMVVAAIPASRTYPRLLNRLRRSLNEYGFESRNRTLEIWHDSAAQEGTPYYVYFVVKETELYTDLSTFVEFIRQCRLIEYPIIINMLWCDLKKR